jgi:transposase
LVEVSLGNYLKMADTRRVQALLELGWSYRRIERETGTRRETIARYDPGRGSKPASNVITGSQAKAANVITGSEAQPETVIPGPASVAEPFRESIEAGVAKGLTAQRILQDLREEYGYAHAYPSVMRFVRKLRRRRPELVDVMEHPPGQEAQVDYFQGPLTWDSLNRRWRRAWIFRMTLSCSRHGYEQPMWGQDRRSFLRAHEHAFEFFGGVPKVVRHDNLKAAVVRACLYDPDVSEVYSAFAQHWGFVPLPSRPYHPQENGIAENSGGYVKENALKGHLFQSLDELCTFLERWNRTIARLRIHGTTRKQVYAHFLEADQPALQPLPTSRFELFEVGARTVHVDGHVEVAAGYYSVPEMLLGVAVRVQWDEHLVRVFAGGRCVTIHPRVLPGQYSTKPEHRSAHRPARQQAYLATLLTKVEHIGSQASAWAQAAITERDIRAYRLLQGLVSLTRKHQREHVDWACGVALHNGSFRYQTLTRLLEQQPEPDPRPQLTQEHDCIRELTHYALIS